MRCGIYISSAITGRDRQKTYMDLLDRLRESNRSGAHIKYRAVRLNEPVQNGDEACDVILIAHRMDADHDHAVVQDIKKFRKNNPDAVIAVSVKDIDYKDTDVKCAFAFNATAAGAALVYGATHERPLQLRVLVDSIITKKIHAPVVSPEMASTPTSETQDIGDIRITRVDTEKGKRAFVSDLRTGAPIDAFVQGEANALWALAAYQGSYLNDNHQANVMYDEPLNTPREKSTITKVYAFSLSQKFKTLGWGAIQQAWGVGRYVQAGDFKLPRTKVQDFKLPFEFASEKGYLRYKDKTVQLALQEAKLMRLLINAQGTVLPYSDIKISKDPETITDYKHARVIAGRIRKHIADVLGCSHDQTLGMLESISKVGICLHGMSTVKRAPAPNRNVLK